MKTKMIKNDIKRNPLGYLSLVLFITFSSVLLMLSTMIVTHLMTSMTAMYDVAKPPHFLQMHKGDLDQEAINRFNAQFEGFSKGQTVAMINLDGSDLTIEGDNSFSLAESRIDIGLVKQNSDFDFLLDDKRQIIQLKPGEIGIPIILLDHYAIKMGDTVTVTCDGIKKLFKVVTYVHDAQMNSSLVSSTRILLNDKDFDDLFVKTKSIEYIIEAYMENQALANDYQTAYENAGLPSNGPAITYSQIFLISALEDIILVAMTVLVSFSMIFLALLAIRYTLMASLEESITDIGTMKAIGFPFKDIRYFYYHKYQVIILIGLSLGYVLSLLIVPTFLQSINQRFTSSGTNTLTYLTPVFIFLIIYLISTTYCKMLLKAIKKLTIVEALVEEKGFKKSKKSRDNLSKLPNLSLDFLLAFKTVFDALSHFKLIAITSFLLILMMLLPSQLVTTMTDKNFMSYLGAPVSDIMMTMTVNEASENDAQQIEDFLANDIDLYRFETLKEVRLEAKTSQNDWKTLKIDSGPSAGKGLKYLVGQAPQTDKEIALSQLNANELGKGVGDAILLRVNNEDVSYHISGIYQDITNGGLTAKTISDFSHLTPSRYQWLIWLKDEKRTEVKVNEWRQVLPSDSDVEDISVFLNQTLGAVTQQIKVATVLVTLIGLLIMSFLLILFVSLRLAHDKSQIAILKALGFTSFAIRKQYLYQMIIVTFLGSFFGVLLAMIFGEKIVSAFFSLLNVGITKITFIGHFGIYYVIFPILLLFVVGIVVWIRTRTIKKEHILSFINE
ncbi:ABC transporter permease [Streptococcus zalophi]|uniref:FtsX-like permease family protein n=1 Tax=Streptococcus zalophi TaxID=640031 RepID=A0A934P993_9STRE|nr:ABC transporter permease [Streptococcus zalophi]MBJ8349481.1 FtsX-like permease family protein [Streptococcus zalophi]